MVGTVQADLALGITLEKNSVVCEGYMGPAPLPGARSHEAGAECQNSKMYRVEGGSNETKDVARVQDIVHMEEATGSRTVSSLIKADALLAALAYDKAYRSMKAQGGELALRAHGHVTGSLRCSEEEGRGPPHLKKDSVLSCSTFGGGSAGFICRSLRI